MLSRNRPSDKFSYFTFGLSGYIDSLLLRIRETIYQLFLSALNPAPGDTVLDIGVSPDAHPTSNHLEKRYFSPQSIIALSVEPRPELRALFPSIRLLCGDGRDLPLFDTSIDLVYSHAVIEHVGSRAEQARFIAEALRVSRKGVLITTPNRWHPIETHTGLPLLHFLPPPICHRLYRLLGKGMYASQTALNLLSRGDLVTLAQAACPPGWSFQILEVRWLGLPSNLVLAFARRKES